MADSHRGVSNHYCCLVNSQSPCSGYKDKVLILQPVYSFKLFCISWARRAHVFVCQCQKVAAICWNYVCQQWSNENFLSTFIQPQPKYSFHVSLTSLEQAKPHATHIHKHTHNSSGRQPVVSFWPSWWSLRCNETSSWPKFCRWVTNMIIIFAPNCAHVLLTATMNTSYKWNQIDWKLELVKVCQLTKLKPQLEPNSKPHPTQSICQLQKK